MAPRKALYEISPNRQRGKDLNAFERGQIKAHHAHRLTHPQIARLMNKSPNTISTSILEEKTRRDGITKPRPGAPQKTTARDRRRILYVVKKSPDATYAKIRAETGINISNSTIHRILDSLNMDHWIAKKRPFLSKDQVKARLAWAEERKDWTFDDFAKVIFTDECSVERGSGKRPKWIWCYKHQRLDTGFVQTYGKGTNLSIMIWAGIWLGDRSNIHFMRRDESSKHSGYSAASYQEVLDEQVPQIYEPGMIWQQDNASIHTAGVIIDWLANNAIAVLPWPANSPDLNPIEHCWAYLKDYLNKHHPRLASQGQSEQAIRAYQAAIEEAWLAIGQELIDACIMSMMRRVQAVITAKGWYTKY